LLISLGMIAFWLTFYIACLVSPPIDMNGHSVMPLPQAIIAFFIAFIAVLILLFKLYKKI
jgi:hypothetical protein